MRDSFARSWHSEPEFGGEIVDHAELAEIIDVWTNTAFLPRLDSLFWESQLPFLSAPVMSNSAFEARAQISKLTQLINSATRGGIQQY